MYLYFPIFRGRQFELLALKDCLEADVLSGKIIPIIEPVKLSSTFLSTLKAFIDKNRSIAVINNPEVGSWERDRPVKSEDRWKKAVCEKCVLPAYHLNAQTRSRMESTINGGVPGQSVILLCDDPEALNYYDDVAGSHSPLYNIIPDKGEFRRRIRHNRVVCEDHFTKRARNVDYQNVGDEFFSSDHLYYEDDGYVGFSDYSIVGKDYFETGFAPYAVAIHIVYFDPKKNLRIAHFVSDSNEDIQDPSRKFAESAGKLVEWNKEMNLRTLGIREIESAFEDERYPGLGAIKKCSIMHHLELVSQYLNGAGK